MLHAFTERKLPQCHSLGTLSSRTEDDRDSERISSAKIIILTTYESAVQGAMKLEAGAYLLKTHLGRRFPRPLYQPRCSVSLGIMGVTFF
jgi:hypothetical protein